MASFNKVILVGNLTRDPELKYLPNNTAVCEFGLAVNHRWKDRDGNQREDVCFVDVSVFGKGGEVVNQYMTKGRPILVEGRLKYDTWTAQDGTKRSKHSVMAENFTFLGGREGGGSEAGAGGAASGRGGRGEERDSGPGSARSAAPRSYERSAPPPMDEEPPRPSPEDIPF